MIAARTVRLIAIGVCGAGIAGMIVTSALDHTGAAITFGILTAIAILCSMVATAVAADTLRRGGVGVSGAEPGAEGMAWRGREEALAEVVEDGVGRLVAGGADEQAVRQVVGEAVRLGRVLGPPRS